MSDLFTGGFSLGESLKKGAGDVVSKTWKGFVSGLTGDKEMSIEQPMHDVANSGIEGFNAGITEGLPDAKLGISTWMDAIVNQSRTDLQSRSPSQVFKRIGIDTLAGFRLGFAENRASFMEFIRLFIEEAVLTAHMQASTAYSVGRAFSGGIEAGIRDGIDGIKKAAIEAAHAAEEALREESETHSPSRKMMSVGRDMIAGLNQGLTSPVSMQSLMSAMKPLSNIQSGNTSSTTVVISGPIVENMVVPNSAASRRAAQDISREISRMAKAKRSPA